MRGNDLRDSMHRWDMFLMKLFVEPSKELLFALFYDEVNEHPARNEDMAFFHRLPHDSKRLSYDYLHKLRTDYLERQRAEATIRQSRRGYQRIFAATTSRSASKKKSDSQKRREERTHSACRKRVSQ